MPIHEYKCNNCGELSEEFYLSQKEVKNKIKCKKCGKYMNKLVSSSNFHLKGSGWYVTDYKNKTDKKKE